MKKLLLLIIASILFIGCDSNNLDSKIKSAIKEVYGAGCKVTSFKDVTTFDLSYKREEIFKQQNNTQPLIWKLDKITGVLNSGEITHSDPDGKSASYSYSWETTDVFVVLLSNYQFKYSVPKKETERNYIQIIVTYK